MPDQPQMAQPDVVATPRQQQPPQQPQQPPQQPQQQPPPPPAIAWQYMRACLFLFVFTVLIVVPVLVGVYTMTVIVAAEVAAFLNVLHAFCRALFHYLAANAHAVTSAALGLFAASAAVVLLYAIGFDDDRLDLDDE